MAKKKIGLYILHLGSYPGDVQEIFDQLMQRLKKMSNVKKRYSLGGDKFTVLGDVTSYKNIPRHLLLFKTAKKNYRPNLLHFETANERSNPKTKPEGDRNNTHIIAKHVNGEVMVFLEITRDGINMNQFMKYLNHYLSHLSNWKALGKPYFSFDVVAKENLIEEINNLDRVQSTELIVEKSILGSDALNYNKRQMKPAKANVSLTVKAKFKEDLKNIAIESVHKMIGGNTEIVGVRITGKSGGNDIKLRSDLIEKREYMDVPIIAETGEVNSNRAFEELEVIAHRYG